MYVILILLGFLLAEFWVISLVGDAVGGVAAFGLLVLGALFGGWLIRSQNARTREALLAGGGRNGLTPSLFTLFSGLLFIFPGFISDGLALLLLLPPVRLLLLAGLGSFLASRLISRMQTYSFRHFGGPGTGNYFGGNGSQTGFDLSEAFRRARQERQTREERPDQGSGDDTIIEGEFRDVTEEARAREKKADGQDALSRGACGADDDRQDGR